LIEELADVEICIEQLKLHFGEYGVLAVKEQKLLNLRKMVFEH
jgi:hypothetical protein